MKPGQVIRASAEAIAQEVRGETVILDLASEKYFSLDEVGTRVWQLIQDPVSLASLKSQLLSEFEVEETTLESDLVDLVETLVSEGLATVSSDSE